MSEKWIERITTAALILGCLLSMGLLLAGCTAITLVAWKLA